MWSVSPNVDSFEVGCELTQQSVRTHSVPAAEFSKRGEEGGIALIMSAYHAVLAVKDECEDALAACGGLRSMTAARAVIGPTRAIPPTTISEIPP